MWIQMERGVKVKQILLSGLLLLLLTPIQAPAQSRFDGTWKIDLDARQPPTKPEVYLLRGGVYRCPSCDPPLDIQADGRDHKITGEACYDTVSLKVVDDRTTEETDKRNGKTVGTSRMTVSSDGSTATFEWTESCNAKGDLVSGKDIMSRIEKGPQGAHPVSGSWQITKRVQASDNALIVTLKLEGDTFSFADPTGQGYEAKLDGTETPIRGDLENTLVSVKRIGEDTIEETDKRGGKTVEVVRFTASADGMAISVTMEDKVKESTRQFFLRKQ
jgi:hypothetical protein